MKKYFDNDGKFSKFEHNPDEVILEELYKKLSDLSGFLTFLTVEEAKKEILVMQNMIWDFQDLKFKGEIK